MIDDVYNSKLLEYAGNICRVGTLESPDATAKAHSKLCGSTISIDLKMDDDVVSDFAQIVKACALGQSAASIVASNIIGAKAQELRDTRSQMIQMLKEEGEPPQGRFAELKYLQPVKDYKARHASTLLVFDAIVDAIDQIERQKEPAA
ncbi:iron-sulfur cluster assembly scaffold protein [Ahrensia sp. 13_GOM-1096m]|uniref:iron-sulfur cluster assembly scaffold protein n=1 Tax=Ahrensia sp. 13_GOM-1096m TaxID=1380380 RepID=UPI00047E84D1|nr:iron-sulfur cluster assembly scaffold protein [Ahrensia sp. 13_GOM-1096m]